MLNLQTHKVIVVDSKVGFLFTFSFILLSAQVIVATCYVISSLIELWHSHLGHVSLSHIQPIISNGLLGFNFL